MTVRELLGRIDSVELSEWMALYHLEAEDEKRRALRAKAAGKNKSRKPVRRRFG